MSKLTHILLALLLCAAVAFALASCTPQGTDDAGNTATSDGTSQARSGQRAHVHTYSAWVVLEEATCFHEGKKYRICTGCDEIEIVTIDEKAPHTIETCNVSPPGCTTTGYTGDQYCTVCGALVAQGQSIAATGHTYKNGYCTKCGAVAPGGGSLYNDNDDDDDEELLAAQQAWNRGNLKILPFPTFGEIGSVTNNSYGSGAVVSNTTKSQVTNYVQRCQNTLSVSFSIVSNTSSSYVAQATYKGKQITISWVYSGDCGITVL